MFRFWQKMKRVRFTFYLTISHTRFTRATKREWNEEESIGRRIIGHETEGNISVKQLNWIVENFRANEREPNKNDDAFPRVSLSANDIANQKHTSFSRFIFVDFRLSVENWTTTYHGYKYFCGNFWKFLRGILSRTTLDKYFDKLLGKTLWNE